MKPRESKTMSIHFGFPHTGWNKPVKEKSIWEIFRAGILRFLNA